MAVSFAGKTLRRRLAFGLGRLRASGIEYLPVVRASNDSTMSESDSERLDIPEELSPPTADSFGFRRALAKVREFPHTPGVYLFKDAAGAVLYIGKALSLRKRVQSYFNDRELHAVCRAVQEVAARELHNNVRCPRSWASSACSLRSSVALASSNPAHCALAAPGTTMRRMEIHRDMRRLPSRRGWSRRGARAALRADGIR